ncbi:uncharacterized protein LOC108850387 [Raphanus sativus]|uniref:Uncharacterized protein LOC108850387 n=1 Tax=Raphanus sativus TaxID=3726 RepID=A0A9W3DJA6_RAPSA|nr:uncharacterized protein LOC108850387 [Raphanus sativus]
MEAMVEAQTLHHDWRSLEKLLFQFLKVNAKTSHRYIFAAFIDLLLNSTLHTNEPININIAKDDVNGFSATRATVGEASTSCCNSMSCQRRSGNRGRHLVHCRLDRTLANSSWYDTFPQSRCHYLRFEGSDHRPVHSTFSSARRKMGKIFRFDRRLKDVEEVRKLIESTWNASPQCSVAQRLVACRRAIVQWSREHYSNSRKTIDELRHKLDAAMADQATEDAIAIITKALLEAYKAEEAFWKQRSRLLWLTLGDKNTGFFHAVSKGRQARNRLTMMESVTGEPLYEEEHIAAEIARYFTEIFTTCGSNGEDTVERALSRRISSEVNKELTTIPSATEIRKALFAIHPDKSPGPDGFSASFFQANWNTVGPAIVDEVRGFFITGIMPESINKTQVRLIPKGQHALKVADYRPIALCNVYYKIISKILSLRLRPVLSSVISENQSAFLPGRAIADNVLITHEILHYLKNSDAKKHCYMAVKTDMSKAYDRLEWDFVRLVFDKLGFDAIWVHWVLQCISTVTYSFLVNDSALGQVIPQRGIRQGDPLSPYIFILCGEVLSGLCRAGQDSGELSGVKIGQYCPRVNHLLFADDTMFFAKATAECCSYLTSTLKAYEKASGQLINATKSSIFFSSKTPQETRRRVKSILGIEKEGGVGKYLGLPELFTRKKSDLFSSIVDRIKLRAAAWSTRRLSSAGKLTMLKSVLSAVPTYAMSCFPLPIGLCNQIQSALTRFWWDNDPSARKICWISYEALSHHKDSGGLGLRDIQDFNVAMLAKNSWRILQNPGCLLARLLCGKYCHNASLLTVTCSSSASHGWRGVVAGFQLLKLQLGKAIGNGQTTKIWSDSWISPTAKLLPYGPPTEVSRDLVVADLLTRETGEWITSMVEAIFPELAHLILLIKPSVQRLEDGFVWLKTKTGIYSVKSGYYALREETVELHISPNILSFKWQQHIWKSPSPPKLHLFLWKLCRGALPLGSSLLARGINISGLCPHCNEPETALHLFFLCPFAVQVWEQAPFRDKPLFSETATLHECFTTMSTLIALPPTGVSSSLTSWILWGIWTSRNTLVFENRAIPAKTALVRAITSAREWLLAQATLPKRSLPVQGVIDLPPLQANVVLCNTDAAWIASQRAGLGWTFHHTPTGLAMEGSRSYNHVSSPLMAEALAMREAMAEAKRCDITNVWFRTDSQELTRAINSKTLSVELFGVLMDIEFLSSSFDFCFVSFISRDSNVAADLLAKSALHSYVPALY